MELSTEDKQRLGVALNEARLLGVELDREKGAVGVTFEVLMLPPEGPAPADRRVQFVFHPVGCVLASLRAGAWNDRDAPVEGFEAGQLLEVVQSFGGQPIYGWDFIDVEDEAGADGEAEGDASRWLEQLSFSWEAAEPGVGRRHHLTLFQEGADKHLDVRVFFDRFAIFDSYGNPLGVREFAAGGERWWKAFQRGDPRTEGFGIVPSEDDA